MAPPAVPKATPGVNIPVGLHTCAQTPTFRGAPVPGSRRASLTLGAPRRAGRAGHAGRGAGGGEIDNRFGGLQGISLLEPKPHKPNPLPGPTPPGADPPVPRTPANRRWSRPLSSAPVFSGGFRTGVSQGDRRGEPESRVCLAPPAWKHLGFLPSPVCRSPANFNDSRKSQRTR